ncbi:MAG: hypothetical protein IKT40_12900 [Bacilli bacterium]|nr:hypothetical protein [Bacilli bacterium]
MGMKIEGTIILNEDEEDVIFDIDYIEAMKNGFMKVYLGDEDITDWLLTPVAQCLS